MSGAAMTWARAQTAGSISAKAVLLILADMHRAGGDLFVGHKALALAAEASERTILAALARLEAGGILVREPRHNPRTGHRTTDLITLQIEAQPAKSAAGAPAAKPQNLRVGQTADFAGGEAGPNRNLGAAYPQNLSVLTAKSAAQYPTSYPEELSKNPPIDPQRALVLVAATPSEDWVQAFETWWTIYPNKVSKLKARELFKRTVTGGRATVAELLDGAERYLTDPRVLGGYIKDPGTWLNQGCWADQPQPRNPQQSRIGFSGLDFAAESLT